MIGALFLTKNQTQASHITGENSTTEPLREP